VSDWRAIPREYAEKMQLDVRMRVDEALDEPRGRVPNDEAELLVQLAIERGNSQYPA
jgi:hypothetical protein